ncbi:MAG: 3-oxoacyl-[acyl-carrier-protein] synthase-3 [Pirellulaceae bacterium]|jgi:3-oxoacyl-[acyl-carrier-protein] synthase-3
MDQPAPQIGNSGRSRMGRLTGVQILATGSYVPEPIVRNEDLAELGYNADWIIQRTGISQRRKADSNTATSDLAYEAAIRCLRQANVGVNDVDMILVATMTPDTPMPSTACYLQKRLGALAPAMDINAACAGFMYAMVTGMQFVATGTCKRVLVVGADVMSRTVDPEDHKTFPLFGDGAGAALLGPGEANQGLLSFTLGSEGDFGEYLCQPAGGSREPTTAASLAEKRQFIQMDGRAVFKWAVRLVADSVQDVLNHANVTAADVDLLVLHQANFRIIDAAVQDLGIDREKVVVNLDQYGNTSAGSIPLALDEANRQGRVKAGDKILLCGFGGGLAWGGALVQW